MISKLLFQILTLDKYNATNHGDVIKTTYLDMAMHVANFLERKRISVTTTNMFAHFLPDSVIFKIAGHITEQLVLMGY